MAANVCGNNAAVFGAQNDTHGATTCPPKCAFCTQAGQTTSFPAAERTFQLAAKTMERRL